MKWSSVFVDDVLVQAHSCKVLVKPFSADGKDLKDSDSACETIASLQSGRSGKETKIGTNFMCVYVN